MLRLKREIELMESGTDVVVGIDEVGRGPFAGPVVAAAVIFPVGHSPIPGVKDSKKISKSQLPKIAAQIQRQAVFAIGEGSVEAINSQGIVPATVDAMNQSISQLERYLSNTSKILIDGLTPKSATIVSKSPIDFIVKGDQKVYSIAAASIVAKVYRDNLMKKLANVFPQYDWENNVGYGTKKHCEAIKKYGITSHHRTQFCRKLT